MRIGFLFNHDQAHQVAHSLPIALEMLRSEPQMKVVVATSGESTLQEVKRLAGNRFDQLSHISLSDDSSRSTLTTLLERLVPARKVGVYNSNIAFFRTLDALVVPDKTALLLRRFRELAHLKLIHTRHGAGDRAIGFNAASSRFDLILVSGPRIRDRLIAETGARPEQIAVVGYQKFSTLADSTARKLPLQANGKPTVLYNPHPSPRLSSWFKIGPQIIEYFRQSDEYNLIFAPHVMLFHRRFALTIEPPAINAVGSIRQPWLDAPNILIDTGSTASIDMTYTQCADIYLGDASSQVYEFLHRPRPVLFANPNRHAWRDDPNFSHWTAGPVLDDVRMLDFFLKKAVMSFDTYRPIQQKLVNERFEITETPAPRRAANAIAAYLTGRQADENRSAA